MHLKGRTTFRLSPVGFEQIPQDMPSFDGDSIRHFLPVINFEKFKRTASYRAVINCLP